MIKNFIISLFITLTPFCTYMEEITDENSLNTVIMQMCNEQFFHSLYG